MLPKASSLRRSRASHDAVEVRPGGAALDDVGAAAVLDHVAGAAFAEFALARGGVARFLRDGGDG